MSRLYTVTDSDFTPTGGANDSVLVIVGAATIMTKLRRLELSSDLTSSSTVVDVIIQHVTDTTSTAGTEPTPTPLDANDAAALFDAFTDLTVEPDTLGADIWVFKWNPQVPYTVVFGPGEEPCCEGGTTQGIAVTLVDAFATKMSLSALIEEF